MMDSNNSIDHKNKKVFITGATSGIGRELALLFLEQGADVVAHGNTDSHIISLQSVVNSKRFTIVKGDLLSAEGCDTVNSTIKKEQPDILVLNAGYNIRKELTNGWLDSEINDMLQVNMISPILSAKTFSQLAKTDPPRRLAFVLSTSCHFAREKMGPYVAAKMGLMGYGKVMQQESSELGVITTLFYPGRTNTGFSKIPNNNYMNTRSAAIAIASVLNLPGDVVPFEFTFRPFMDTYI